MYIKSMRGWLRHLDFIILDILVLELGLLVLRYNEAYFVGITGGIVGNLRMLALVVALASLCEGIFRDSYHEIMRREPLMELKAAAIHVGITQLVMFLVAYSLKIVFYPFRMFLFVCVAEVFVCLTVRTLWKDVIRVRASNVQRRRQMLLVALPFQAEELVAEWKSKNSLSCELCGICFTAPDPENRKEVGGVPVIGDMTTVWEYIQKNVVDEALVQPGHILSSEDLNMFVQAGLMVHMDVEHMAHFVAPTHLENFAGITVLTAAMRLAQPWEFWLKRLVDIIGSLVGLLLTGIACIFVVPAIKLQDPGPAFFSQTRVGKNGRRFKIYKFRSMYQDAEARKAELMAQNEMKGALFKIKNDPRIIPGVGPFIRKTSVDELPQFWNVLKGDMSLVGTRPPTEDEYNSYEMRYLRRMAVKPGITGIWQTSGRNSVVDFDEVVKMDTEYINNWSLWLDITLLFKTVKVVLFDREGAV